MATLYCDFENGNDNYAGSSFAVLAEGTNGRISSTTFSSAGASFPNDGSLINQYLSIFNGTIYAVYQITAWVSSTSLTIAAISGGTALANQAVDRQYYIGGRWKSLTSGATAARIAPGDEIRVMGSPAPTSLGINGTWSGGQKLARFTNPALSNTTPIVATITNHGLSTGDTVVVYGVTGNTNANGTWEITVLTSSTFELNGSVGNGTTGGTRYLQPSTRRRVQLASALTANIACTGKETSAAWTGANANVTSTTTSAGKEHSGATIITIADAFTTGKAAYYTLPATLDLSSYQQVSFWFMQTAGTVSATNYTLKLCTDTTGDVSAHDIPVPSAISTNGGNGQWQPVTVDLATNLNAAIKSIALYATADLGAATFRFDNIIACKAASAADALTLNSLIGKNTSGDSFYTIQSINGTRIMLSCNAGDLITNTDPPVYQGASETVTTWKRETIKTAPSTNSTAAVSTVQDSGTSGSPITYSFGWDRTAMTTRNLETWLDGSNSFGYGLQISNRNYINISNVSFVRYNIGLFTSGTFHTCEGVNATGDAQGCSLAGSQHNVSIVSSSFNYTYGIITTASRSTFTLGNIDSNGSNGFGYGVYLNPASNNTFNVITSCSGNHDQNIRFSAGSTNNLFKSIGLLNNCRGNANSCGALFETQAANNTLSVTSVNDNAVYGFYVTIGSWNNKIIGGTSSNSGTAGIYSTGASSFYLQNFTIEESAEAAFASTAAGYDARIYSHNHDNTANNHRIFTDGGLISSATDERKTASGISWKLQPTSADRDGIYPLTLPLAKVACAANSLVTVKAWMRRTNTGLTMRLVCKGGQIAGVTNDVVSAMTAAADTWEELTITFTPTEVGVVEITAEAWGGTTFSGWVDDLTISQA